MDYSKFYTPPKIANLLVDELNISEPEKVVDICCGSCNLLTACKRRWNDIELYGVDVNNNLSIDNVMFENKDGREFAIEHTNEFSLVVANPPFDFVESRKQFPDLLEGDFKNISTSRLEVEMLIANLCLLKENGALLIIMPSSFVEGETYKKFRILIANNYYVESIIKLDELTFGPSKINSYALIIFKEQHLNRTTKLGYSSEDSCNLIFNSTLSYNKMVSGEWNINKNENSPLILLDIRRGNVSSAHFIKKGEPVLHTSKNKDNWEPSKRCLSKKILPSVYAENGDIIVSRIGKSAGQWTRYTGDKVAISDCLYRIKDPDGAIHKKIQGRTYNKAAKGVATRYITISDFCSWIYEND